MKIEVNEISINYQLAGDGDCLVLIHGFTDNLNMWYKQVPEFSKHCQVLSYDVRGHGQTETPQTELSSQLFAEDLQALLSALKIDKAVILGYSMGGRIALQFALKYPERARALIFANSVVRGSNDRMTEEQIEQLAKRREQMIDLLRGGDIQIISDVMTERSLSPGTKDRAPDLFQEYKDIKMQNDPRHYLSIMQAMIAATAAAPDLSLLRCPALIIAGEQDGLMPIELVKSMKASIKNSTSIVLATGHASALEDPEGFNRAVLAFVRKLK